MYITVWYCRKKCQSIPCHSKKLSDQSLQFLLSEIFIIIVLCNFYGEFKFAAISKEYNGTQKEITSQNDFYLISLTSY